MNGINIPSPPNNNKKNPLDAHGCQIIQRVTSSIHYYWTTYETWSSCCLCKLIHHKWRESRNNKFPYTSRTDSCQLKSTKLIYESTHFWKNFLHVIKQYDEVFTIPNEWNLTYIAWNVSHGLGTMLEDIICRYVEICKPMY